MEKKAKTLWYEYIRTVGVLPAVLWMCLKDFLCERTAQPNPYLYHTTKMYLQMTSNTCLKTTKQSINNA